VEERSFYNCLSCYADELASLDFDPVAFAAELEERVVQPLEDAQAMFDRLPYMTRLTSSVSPEEMTVDPTFAFNSELQDVENVRQATLVFECGDSATGTPINEAPRRIELRDGTVIRLEPESVLAEAGQSSSDALAALDEPAASVIEQTSGTGLPTVVADNRPMIDEQIEQHNELVTRVVDDGSCAAAPGSLFALLGFLALRRRRRA
ncbi:MAG: hypothetical protein AAF658_09320, partial [Myxococcota bacterium]